MSKCIKCGAELESGEKFCGNCGTKVIEEKPKKIKNNNDIEKATGKVKETKTSKAGKPINLSKGKIIVLAVVVIIAFVCAIFKDDISYKITQMKEDKVAEKNIEAANIKDKWLDGEYDVGEDLDEGRYYVIGLDDFNNIYLFDSKEDCKKYDEEWDNKYLDLDESLSRGEEASIKIKEGQYLRIEGSIGYKKSN